MDYKRKIGTAIATGALLLNAFAPLAFAETTITINGNGSGSNNDANVSLNQETKVEQKNDAQVNNDVEVNADTGDNDANNNTGGDVSIDTGNAEGNVNVTNSLNANSASVDCCNTGDSTVKISGNGSNSDNNVNLDMDNKTEVKQDNKAKVNTGLMLTLTPETTTPTVIPGTVAFLSQPEMPKEMFHSQQQPTSTQQWLEEGMRTEGH